MKRAESLSNFMVFFYAIAIFGVLFAGIYAMEFEHIGVINIVLSVLAVILVLTVVHALISILSTLEEIRDGVKQTAPQKPEETAPKPNPYPLGKPIYVIDEPSPEAK